MTIDTANEVLRLMIGTGGACFASLHTGPPGENGAAEVRGGGYRRLETEWAEPEGGSITLAHALVFDQMPPCTVSHLGIWTQRSGGWLRWWAPLETGVSHIRDRDTLLIDAGSLTIELRRGG